MDIRARLCFWISRKLIRPPEIKTVDYSAYESWRTESLTSAWKTFEDSFVENKDILDFGCGDGQLTFFVAANKNPKSTIGVDINDQAIERAKQSQSALTDDWRANVEFRLGTVENIPVPDRSIDTIAAFDCLEHVMDPKSILEEWFRVLRPHGCCLIEWFPLKGPWGPHMEALIPIPWAHVIFGEKAMFRAAEAIYDLSEFVPRHWDLDENGNKKPNKWKAWSSFAEQNYINDLNIPTFRRLALEVGFDVERLELRSFGGSPLRKFVSSTLKSLPVIGEYFVSSTAIVLRRP